MLQIITLVLGTILTITALQTLAFYVIWYFERRTFRELSMIEGVDNTVRPVPGIVAIIAEWASISVLVLTYPLRLIHDASPVITRRRGETPIILVHGYGGDSANFLWLQWRLKWRGWHNVYSVSYTPPTINARKLSQQIVNHVERILRATGAEKAHLVCHSMGGPLTRYALHHLDLAGKVDRVVTLGSPHAGSRIANLFPARGAAYQMRYPSKFLDELNALDPTPGGARFYSIFSNFDNFVLPVSSSVLGGNARNIHVPYHGHCALLYSPKVMRAVEQALRGELDGGDESDQGDEAATLPYTL